MAAAVTNKKVPELTSIFGQNLGTDIVNIAVGPEATAKMFAVHKALLCSQSPVFQKMFNGGFKEGITQSATLPEDVPGIFEMFLTWLYRGKIEWVGAMKSQVSDLVLFADKYQIIPLMDQSIDAFILQSKALNLGLTPTGMIRIYANTSQGCKMRLLAARCFVHRTVGFKQDVNTTWTNANMEKAAKEQEDLWRDSYALMRNTSGLKVLDPLLAPACDYHQHGKDEPCPYEQPSGW